MFVIKQLIHNDISSSRVRYSMLCGCYIIMILIIISVVIDIVSIVVVVRACVIRLCSYPYLYQPTSHFPPTPVSSLFLKRGFSIKYLLPDSVIAYIYQNKLFGL